MRIFDVGASEGPEVVHDRTLTVPNALSVLRLLVLPWVLRELLQEHWMSAFWWLATFAWTDWLDGYVARRFDQVTRLGKLLDPISDRLLFVVVGVGMIVSGVVPWWVIGVLLLRDVIVIAGGLYLAARHLRPPAVTRVGKAATFGLMWALPAYLLAAGLGDGPAEPHRGVFVAASVAWAVSTVLYYVALVQYAIVGVGLLRVTDAGTDAGTDDGAVR